MDISMGQKYVDISLPNWFAEGHSKTQIDALANLYLPGVDNEYGHPAEYLEKHSPRPTRKPRSRRTPHL